MAPADPRDGNKLCDKKNCVTRSRPWPPLLFPIGDNPLLYEIPDLSLMYALVSTTTRRTVIPDLVFFGPHRGPHGARTDHIDHRMTVGNAQLYGSESRNHVHHANHQAPQYHARRIGVRSRRERSLDRGVPVIHVPIKDTPPHPPTS